MVWLIGPLRCGVIAIIDSAEAWTLDWTSDVIAIMTQPPKTRLSGTQSLEIRKKCEKKQQMMRL